MAYDLYTAERITRMLEDKKVDFFEKKMFGGLCYMVDNKMCMGLLHDKKRESDFLMARVGEAASEECLTRDGSQPMDFTGRPMKGYVFVRPEGYDMEEDMEFWVAKCLAFNPEAVASKKKPKKAK